jgi:hypothetical protein
MEDTQCQPKATTLNHKTSKAVIQLPYSFYIPNNYASTR